MRLLDADGQTVDFNFSGDVPVTDWLRELSYDSGQARAWETTSAAVMTTGRTLSAPAAWRRGGDRPLDEVDAVLDDVARARGPGGPGVAGRGGDGPARSPAPWMATLRRSTKAAEDARDVRLSRRRCAGHRQRRGLAHPALRSAWMLDAFASCCALSSVAPRTGRRPTSRDPPHQRAHGPVPRRYATRHGAGDVGTPGTSMTSTQRSRIIFNLVNELVTVASGI